MSQVSVRPARIEDREALAALAEAFHAEDGHPVSAQGTAALAAMLAPANEHGRVLVIEDAGAIVGYAAVCFGYSVEYGGRDAFVDDLYVVPAARGKGHARRLYAAIERTAVDCGCRALHLEVMPGNRIERWYRALGYADRASRLLTKRL